MSTKKYYKNCPFCGASVGKLPKHIRENHNKIPQGGTT